MSSYYCHRCKTLHGESDVGAYCAACYIDILTESDDLHRKIEAMKEVVDAAKNAWQQAQYWDESASVEPIERALAKLDALEKASSRT